MIYIYQRERERDSPSPIARSVDMYTGGFLELFLRLELWSRLGLWRSGMELDWTDGNGVSWEGLAAEVEWVKLD